MLDVILTYRIGVGIKASVVSEKDAPFKDDKLFAFVTSAVVGDELIAAINRVTPVAVDEEKTQVPDTNQIPAVKVIEATL